MVRQVRVGVFIPTFAGGDGAHHDCPYYDQVDWAATRDYVLSVEQLGFNSLWIADHFMLGKENAMLEGWTSLAYLAALTKKLVLGSFVMCNSYRNPALLAKMAATFDIISGGRLCLGLGAGWHEPEYKAYGYHFPPPPERIAALRETTTILKELWQKDSVDFHGKFYHLNGAVCNPKPIQKPHPPIMIGAWGKKMLRLTAEVADSWSIADDPSPAVFQEKFSIIKKRCDEIGRNPAEIERTWSGHVILESDPHLLKLKLAELKDKIMMNSDKKGNYFQLPSGEMTKVDADYLIEQSIHGTPNECTLKLRELTEAGVDHFILFFWDYPSKRVMNLFASQVMPNLT